MWSRGTALLGPGFRVSGGRGRGPPGVLLRLTWPGERSAPAAVAPKPPLLPGQRGSRLEARPGPGGAARQRGLPLRGGTALPGSGAASRLLLVCTFTGPHCTAWPCPALHVHRRHGASSSGDSTRVTGLDLRLPTTAVGFSLGRQILDHLSIYLPSCFQASLGPIFVGFCLFRKSLYGSVGGA